MNAFVSKLILVFVSLSLFVAGAFPQNYRKIERAGVKYVLKEKKSEKEMADDNEHNRKSICYGMNDDGHYVLIAYYHRGYFYNEVWGTIDGSYSVAVYSTKIESSHPIECTHFNYATFPSADLITLCQKYGIKELHFYEDLNF